MDLIPYFEKPVCFANPGHGAANAGPIVSFDGWRAPLGGRLVTSHDK